MSETDKIIETSKEQLNNALAELITTALSGVDKMVEFSKEQIPDVVMQLLWWHGMSSALGCILGLLFLAGGHKLIQICCKGSNENSESGEANWAMKPHYYKTGHFEPTGLFCMGLIAGILLFFIGIIVTVINFEWLKILIAPKLYLLEYAASLIK